MFDSANGSMWIEGHRSIGAHGVDIAECAMEMWTGFGVDDQATATCLDIARC
ncbi:unannotated protein [freshwater metagenome]|uniref:Unannotated protein n=1 Tax=freshwater metagenome TaxID=449393 RepID=A0A6J6C9L4_9ZZZZ